MDLNEAVDLESNFPRGYMPLSELEYRGGDLNAAIKLLSIAMRKFPYIPTPYENLAICYLRAGDRAKASDILHRGLQVFSSDKNLLHLAARAIQP